MVIDTSVVAAIFFNEPERESFLRAITSTERRLIAAPSLLEMHMVLRRTKGLDVLQWLDTFLEELFVVIVPCDLEQARLARVGFDRYGKGKLPAGLNFGDCLVYALARSRNEPLLFKGSDFRLTDVVSAGE